MGWTVITNTSDSYNKGYYKYWSNGVDSIDFICTEQHPSDTLTSIYHGYIKEGKYIIRMAIERIIVLQILPLFLLFGILQKSLVIVPLSELIP